MSYFEEYQVRRTRMLGNPTDRFKLNVDPNPANFKPVKSILLIKGATHEETRTGQEEGDDSATIYLDDDDFALALQFIDVNDFVNYQSEPIVNTTKANIWNFNFPEAD